MIGGGWGGGVDGPRVNGIMNGGWGY
jgi:hypothetical protein